MNSAPGIRAAINRLRYRRRPFRGRKLHELELAFSRAMETDIDEGDDETNGTRWPIKSLTGDAAS